MKGIKSCLLEIKVNIYFLLFLILCPVGSFRVHAQDSASLVFIEKPMAVNIAQKGQSVTLACKAEKEGQTVSYQWYQSPSNSLSGKKIPGAVFDTFTTEPFSEKEMRYYYCKVMAEDGETIFSRVAMAAYTGLPTVYIDIDIPMEQITRESYVLGSLKVVSEGKDTFQYEFTKTEDGIVKEGIKGRGNSTWMEGWVKKSFNIKFDKKKSFFNLPKSKKWCINASYLDKSLLRDKFASVLGNEVFNSEWNPHFVSVDVVMNGEYLGNYIWGEKNNIGTGRIDIQDIDDFTEEKIQTGDYVDQNQDGVIDIKDGGYVLELDARMDAPYCFQTERLASVTFKDPDEVSDTVFNYVKSFVQEAEDVLYTRSFTDPENGWRKYYDETSAIDWYLMNEIANNRDAKDFSSIFKYYDPTDGKLHFGPNWDFDLGYGNDGENGESEYGKSMGWWVRDGVWIARMFEDSAFFANVKARWDDKKSDLNEAINSRLQSLADENALSAECNFRIWKILGEPVGPDPIGYEERTTCQSEVDYMKDWLNERFAWFDEALHNSYYITYDLNGGSFIVSNPSVFISESSQTVVLIDPVKEGFVFAGWTGTGIDGIAKTVTISDDRKGDRKYIAIWENDIESCTVTMNDTVYTGSPYTPEIIVKYGDSLLTPEVDYSVVLPEGRIEAGTYAVTIVGKGDYRGEQVAHFTIAKAPLTVTPQPVVLAYGEEPRDNGVLYDGFVEGETEALLGGTISYEYTYSQFDGIGEYEVTPSGLESDNYDIRYVAGSLLVEPKEIEVMWTDTLLFYNGLEQQPTALVEGLLNNDSCLSITGAQIQAGSYKAQATIVNANYRFPGDSQVVEGGFTIAKAPLDVMAQAATIIYGDEPRCDSVVYQGFVNGETEALLGGTLAYEYSYSQFDGIGEYEIMPLGLESNNYDIRYVPGTLSVEPKEVGVTWTDTLFSYTGHEQAPTAQVEGLLNNDSCGVSVSGAQVEAGFYMALATIHNANYRLSDSRDRTEFRITKVPLVVTAQPAVVSYGDGPHNNGVFYSGFVNDETESVLAGNLSYDYSYSQFDGIGEYLIMPRGLKSNNYDISYMAGTLVVNPKELEIVWTNTTFLYNGQGQLAEAIAIGLVNGDSCEMTVVGAQVNAGTYVARVTGINNVNYRLPETGLEGEFTIHPSPIEDLVIVVDTSSLAYDGMPKTPAVVVKDGATVIPAEEYSVIYSDNLNEGVAEIAIIDNEGGNYVVSGSATFVITEANPNQVWSHDRSIFIDSPVGTSYRIYDLNGRLYRDTETSVKPEEIRMGVDGVYIVLIGGERYKLIIKN
ncbi:MAG: CotH kinase family protein [Paludibacteraceae bacterium]|nr:CotH kinase family protein [Paludibacteraceae bacterium]